MSVVQMSSVRPSGCILVLALLCPALASRVGVWHLTDVHVDPFYVIGSDATKCYCETTASCSVTGQGCLMANQSTGQVPAAKFGNSEGNCATPIALYESGLDFMQKQGPDAPFIYFTGDFAEAGASYPCTPASGQLGAEQQILDVINYDYTELRKRFKTESTLALGCLGNHDSAPGDVFHTAAEGQAWLYDNLTSLWAPDVRDGSSALQTIARGAWYSVPTAAPGLTVISLNINYWSVQNSQLSNTTAHAYAEGIQQFEWLDQELSAATARNEAVHILGHQPPITGGSLARAWVVGHYARFSAIVDKYSATIKAMLFGHIHTDQWTLVRACRNSSAQSYVETHQIKWCSGGGDWTPPNSSHLGPFGAGIDGQCAVIPQSWSDDDGAQACEELCNTAEDCIGFTWYPAQAKGRECCFRTGSVASKPKCSGHNCATCFEKPPAVVCDGAAKGVIIPGVSLTEGWPAMNPGVRMLEFDNVTWELLDMKTFIADLHAANKPDGTLDWKLEYSFKDQFKMRNLSPQSFAALHEVFAQEQGDELGDDLWGQFIGKGGGSLSCKGYSSKTALFKPIYDCLPITSEGKQIWIATLNGTATAP